MRENDLLLDASVLISILEEDDFIEKISSELERYNTFWITSISYLFGYEKCRRMGLKPDMIHEKLSYYKILPTETSTIQKAKEICHDSDFEDALQIAANLENGIPNFITTDQKLAKRYKNLLNIILIK